MTLNAKKECPSCAMEVDPIEGACPLCGYEFPDDSRIGIKVIALIMAFIFIYPIIKLIQFILR